MAEQDFEVIRIRFHGLLEIHYRIFREEQAQHRTDLWNLQGNPGARGSFSNPGGQLLAQLSEALRSSIDCVLYCFCLIALISNIYVCF